MTTTNNTTANNTAAEIKAVFQALGADPALLGKAVDMIKSELNTLAQDKSAGADDYHSKHELLAHVEILSILNEELDIMSPESTMDEVYDRRMKWFAAFVNQHKDQAFKSRLHADGTMFDADEESGWFVVGVSTPLGDYTYHYRDTHWDAFQCPEVDRAPEWDGHLPSDIGRLFSLA